MWAAVVIPRLARRPGQARAGHRPGRRGQDELAAQRIAEEASEDGGEVGRVGRGGGGISNNSGDSLAPAIAVGTGGAVYVAWSDTSGGDAEIYLRRWDGNAWGELGGSATGGGISNNGSDSQAPALAVGADGRPWVAWHDGANREIYVRRWNGTTWAEVGAGSATGGGISDTPRNSSWVDLRLAADGSAVAVWVEARPGNDEVYARRWDGADWVALGDSAAGGGISNTPGRSGRPALALDGAGRPWVAWAETHNNGQDIYLRRWDGAAWTPLGNSATGGGVSQTPGQSQLATLVIGAGNTPLVTWYDSTPGQREIYGATWNGSAWVAAGAGANSGGGISNTPGESQEPSLTLGPSGTPYVVWQEGASAGEIYGRQLSGGVWREIGAGSASVRRSSAVPAAPPAAISSSTAATAAPSSVSAAAYSPWAAWSTPSRKRLSTTARPERRSDSASWGPVKRASKERARSTETGTAASTRVNSANSPAVVCGSQPQTTTAAPAFCPAATAAAVLQTRPTRVSSTRRPSPAAASSRASVS